MLNMPELFPVYDWLQEGKACHNKENYSLSFYSR